MIKKEKIDGKEVTVAYFNSKWQPCDEKVATKIKIRYPDGKVVFAGVAKQEGESEECSKSPNVASADSGKKD